MKPTPEEAKILTMSISHLHPETVAAIDACRGDLPNGPSIAVRHEGFLVNTHLGSENSLERDFTATDVPSLAERFPDLSLIRALGRGLRAAWINLDQDGPGLSDILPIYEEDGSWYPPNDPHWKAALSTTREAQGGTMIVAPSRELLEIIEAGQTPGLMGLDVTRSTLEDQRRLSAYDFYESADLGGDRVINDGGWRLAGDEWVLNVFVENEDPEQPSIKKSLALRFRPHTRAIVAAVYDGRDLLADPEAEPGF